MPSTSSNTLRSGFTLIELLVVIAIIAILASLAFPAVQGALGQGKKAQARNDVNQLAMAVKAYQMEYGKLPPAADLVTSLTSSNANNPRGIVFFEPKNARGNPPRGGISGGKFYDPWGEEYQVLLDDNYDNKVSAVVGTGGSQDFFTTVVVTSKGGSTNTKDIISNVK